MDARGERPQRHQACPLDPADRPLVRLADVDDVEPALPRPDGASAQTCQSPRPARRPGPSRSRRRPGSPAVQDIVAFGEQSGHAGSRGSCTSSNRMARASHGRRRPNRGSPTPRRILRASVAWTAPMTPGRMPRTPPPRSWGRGRSGAPPGRGSGSRARGLSRRHSRSPGLGLLSVVGGRQAETNFEYLSPPLKVNRVGQAQRLRLHLPFRGAGECLLERPRALRRLPLPGGAAPRPRPQLRGGGRPRHPSLGHRGRPGHRGSQDPAGRRGAPVGPPPPLRRSRHAVRRGAAPARPRVPALLAEGHDPRAAGLPGLLRDREGPGC